MNPECQQRDACSEEADPCAMQLVGGFQGLCDGLRHHIHAQVPHERLVLCRDDEPLAVVYEEHVRNQTQARAHGVLLTSELVMRCVVVAANNILGDTTDQIYAEHGDNHVDPDCSGVLSSRNGVVLHNHIEV